MKVLEIEKHFQSEETLEKVLDAISEDVNKIDYWTGLMKDGITLNPEDAKNALNDLTARYMSLKTVLAIADTEKKNREIRHYNKIRIDIGNGTRSEKKFVSATAEKEASAFVSSYRRIRNIIKAYMESAEKGISTMQSILKYLAEESRLGGRKQ